MGATSNAACANGHLFFARQRDLVAQRFDPRTQSLTGEPIPIAERVQQTFGQDHKAVSLTGTLVYRPMQSPANRLVWRNRVGDVTPAMNAPAEYFSPALSPDETRLVFTLFDPRPSERFGFGTAHVRSDLWMLDRSTGATTQLTTDPAADWGAIWSPGGRRIVFSSNRSGRLELYQREIDGTVRAEVQLPSSEQLPADMT